ncbi:hypothetical protein [Actinacidiphila alni]|uniref:hypothetical protein n=1 Tax=Actinacidiphila alni TaxID=380248 RepID=UPI003451BC0B
MAVNPNFPVIETAWGPAWDYNAGAVPADRYVDITGRTMGTFSGSRGRQAELDQVQAGTASVVLSNPDGAIDPANPTGPYAGRILPFQPFRQRAQWPPSVNLLNPTQATCGAGLGGTVIDTSAAGPGIFTETDPAGGQFLASGTAAQGSTVAQFAVAATATVTQWICYTAQPAVRPGQTYTVQLQVRNVTPGTTVQVTAGHRTRDARNAAASTAVGATATLVGNATAAWTQITLTATAAATAAMQFTGVQVVTAPGAACNVQVDAWQLERGAAASAWVQPGPWYGMFAGFTEHNPSQWQMDGTYGTLLPPSTDAFGLLSQVKLPDPLAAEIASHNPRFVYRLDDPAGSTSAADSTGNSPPMPVLNSKYGKGTLSFGAAVTAADPVNGVFTGSSGTVAHFGNPNVGANTYGPCTYLSLTGAGITGPVDAGTGWTRMIAFRYTGATPAYAADLWCSMDNTRNSIGAPAGTTLIISIDSTGHLVLNSSGPNSAGANLFIPPWPTVTDGNWHLVFLTQNAATGQRTFRLDDSGFAQTLPAGNTPQGLTMDSIGAFVDNQIRFTSSNFGGEIAFVAEFPTALAVSDRENLYSAWKASCAGESTDVRYARILRYAGYAGATSIQTGLTTSMGPADFGGQDAVTALQAVTDTEGGAHFVDGSGTVTFQSRAARYNTLTPAYVFGERTDLGEFPYEDCQPDQDSAHLGNQITVTQQGTGQVFTAVDDASVKAYAPRTLSRTINSLDPLECQDAAFYLASRYRQPLMRLAGITLHPSAYPALWPVCLALELGTRVRVMRRPVGAPATSYEQFVENLAWTLDDKGDAVLTVQTSPADTTPYGLFAAWHTTLKTAAAIGATTITVNNSQDNTNPLAAQLAQGQQLKVEPGVTNAETVTVSAVGNTSPGWTSAVITLTAPLAKAHAAGIAVTELLPAGQTNPAAWDSPTSQFDTATFAY